MGSNNGIHKELPDTSNEKDPMALGSDEKSRSGIAAWFEGVWNFFSGIPQWWAELTKNWSWPMMFESRARHDSEPKKNKKTPPQTQEAFDQLFSTLTHQKDLEDALLQQYDFFKQQGKYLSSSSSTEEPWTRCTILLRLAQEDDFMINEEQRAYYEEELAKALLQSLALPKVTHWDISRTLLNVSAQHRPRLNNFFNTLLDCHPSITEIIFHPDNQTDFDEALREKLTRNRLLTTATRLLKTSTSPLPFALRYFNQLSQRVQKGFRQVAQRLLDTIWNDAIADKAQSAFQQRTLDAEAEYDGLNERQQTLNTTEASQPATSWRSMALSLLPKSFTSAHKNAFSDNTIAFTLPRKEAPWKKGAFFFIESFDSLKTQFEKMRYGAEHIIKLHKEMQTIVTAIKQEGLPSAEEKKVLMEVEDRYFVAIFYGGWQQKVDISREESTVAIEKSRVKQYHSDKAKNLPLDLQTAFEEVTRILTAENAQAWKERNKNNSSPYAQCKKQRLEIARGEMRLILGWEELSEKNRQYIQDVDDFIDEIDSWDQELDRRNEELSQAKRERNLKRFQKMVDKINTNNSNAKIIQTGSANNLLMFRAKYRTTGFKSEAPLRRTVSCPSFH